MASHPPSSCCLKSFDHEGKPLGSHKEIAGLDTYQIGEQYGDERLIVILTDIYGNKFNNTLLVADELSKLNESQVLVPDILKGEPVADMSKFQEWMERHQPEENKQIVDGFLKKLHEEKSPKTVFGMGYCFGAKYAIQNLSDDGYFTAAAVAHPSFVAVEEVEAVKKPILISAATDDQIFPEELRNKSINILTKNDIRFQLDLFQGVSHGFAIKGDIKNPVVKYAKEKVIVDQTCFFKQF